jgi:hypothetical protein
LAKAQVVVDLEADLVVVVFLVVALVEAGSHSSKLQAV